MFQLRQRRHARHLIFGVAFVFEGERGGRGAGDFDAQVDPVTLPVNLESPEPNIAEPAITLTTKLKCRGRSKAGTGNNP